MDVFAFRETSSEHGFHTLDWRDEPVGQSLDGSCTFVEITSIRIYCRNAVFCDSFIIKINQWERNTSFCSHRRRNSDFTRRTLRLSSSSLPARYLMFLASMLWLSPMRVTHRNRNFLLSRVLNLSDTNDLNTFTISSFSFLIVD
jgi:hypothetical protein